jgi:putative transposase
MAAEQIPVQVACRVLNVSVSGYYDWRSRPPSARAIHHAWLTDLIVEVHQRARGTYGAHRVHAELRLGRGIVIGHGAVAMLMRRAGLAGATGRPKWRHAKPDQIAADLVDRNFARTGPNQLWVTDITEHPTREGKVYCAVVLDAYSRRVVGWSIDASPTAALVTNALGMAIQTRTPPTGAIIHSDQGVQPRFLGVHPASQELGAPALDGQRRGLLRQLNDRSVLVTDAGRAPRPATLAYPGRAGQRDLRVLEIFHNRQRRHSSLGMLTPIEFENAPTVA